MNWDDGRGDRLNHMACKDFSLLAVMPTANEIAALSAYVMRANFLGLTRARNNSSMKARKLVVN